MVLLVTFFLTVIFDLVVAIEVGMVLAAILFMSRMASTTEVRKWEEFSNNSDDISKIKLPDHTAVYEITGPMFFGASDKFRDIISAETKKCKALILRMRGVPALDATAYEAIADIHNMCKENDITLIISHINKQPLNVLKKQKLYKEIGENNFAPNIYKAIQIAEKIQN